MRTNTLVDINIAGDIYLGADENIQLDKKLIDIFTESDLNIINLEGGFWETDKKLSKAGPSLFQGKETLDILKKLSCKLVTLANNHIVDGDIDNLKYTIQCLKDNFIDTIGAGVVVEEAYRGYIFEKDKIKIGIINGAEGGFGCWDSYARYGYAWIFHELIGLEIERLRIEEKCDIIIGLFHAGVEEINYPLPEWRKVYRKYIDMGLDMIVAHHPHVPQGVEYYCGKPIFYSIGNFIWGGNDKSEVIENKFGILVKVHINVDRYMNVEPEFVDTKGEILEGLERESARNLWETWSDALIQENMNEYEEVINRECIKLFNNFYKKMIFESVGILYSNDGSVLRKIKEYLINMKNIVRKKLEVNKLVLQHNIGIESHRWCCMRAMSLMEASKK